MKNKYLIPLFFLFAVTLFVGGSAFDEPNKMRAEQDDDYQRNYEKSWTADTLTNTELDTLVVGVPLLSKWTYNITLVTTRESGTGNPIMIYQESVDNSNWYEVARDTITATGLYRLNGNLVEGKYARIILDGEGTAEHTYTLKALFKRD